MKKQSNTILRKSKRSKPPEDLTGKRFGKWVVQKYAGKKDKYRLWLCRCDCGVQNNVYEFSLIKADSKQCKRCAWDSFRRPTPKDLTGKRFGKWVVQKYAGKKNYNRILSF